MRSFCPPKESSTLQCPPPPHASARNRAAAHRVRAQASPITATEVPSTTSLISREARKAALVTPPPEVPETKARVRGTIPPWLEGCFIRNGPGNFTPMKHLFDGYAMVFKTRFENGSLFVSSRFLQSKAYNAYRQTGELEWREFGTPRKFPTAMDMAKEVGRTVLGLVGAAQAVTDNPSVNVLPYRSSEGRALAVTETLEGTYVLDMDSLDTVKKVKYQDKIPGDLTTAHPGLDAQGRLINLSTAIGGGFTITCEEPGTMVRQSVASLPHRRGGQAPVWVHSFPCSINHAVVPEYPLYYNIPSIVSGNDVEYLFMDWRPQDGTLFTVVELGGAHRGRATQFLLPSFFSFHQVNSYEEGGKLIVDLSYYASPLVLRELYLEAVRAHPGERAFTNMSPASVRRVEIPLSLLGTPGPHPLPAPALLVSDAQDGPLGAFFEFPVINPAYKGRKNRYVWAVCARRPTNLGNTVCRVDLDTGAVLTHWVEGGIPGEPCFVGRPGATEEDDGVIIASFVGPEGNGVVKLLDARTMEEVAVADLAFPIPYGFHGSFFHGRPGAWKE